MNTRTILSLTAGSIFAAAANAQVTASPAPYTVNYGTGDVQLLGDTNSTGTATNTLGKFTGHFGGDLITQIGGGNVNGQFYSGTAHAIAITPFTIGALPVRINSSSMKFNLKLVASGGTGFPGQQDPAVALTVATEFHQQLGSSPDIFTDADIGVLGFRYGTFQDGNGLRVIDTDLGTVASSVILTPGTYYLYQFITIDASYYGKGFALPTRGATVEFGGDLSSAYRGIDYSFEWETVPAPGAASLVSAGLLLVSRRRR
ncbi:MAG: hypothetical protein ACREJD_07890 [Phycisphaerales bacterium]